MTKPTDIKPISDAELERLRERAKMGVENKMARWNYGLECEPSQILALTARLDVAEARKPPDGISLCEHGHIWDTVMDVSCLSCGLQAEIDRLAMRVAKAFRTLDAKILETAMTDMARRQLRGMIKAALTDKDTRDG